MAKIHVLHENAAWAAPLFEALGRRALPYRHWHLAEGLFDLSTPPPAAAAFEFITDRRGVAYTYDVNTNTNHNAEAEATAGLAGLLGRELAALQTPVAAAAAD